MMSKNITLCFLGDIMPGGVLSGTNENFIGEEVLDIIQQADIRIATLESAIGDDFKYDKEKMDGRMNIIYSKEKDLDRLSNLRINVVSLANNHIHDLGREGLNNTIRLLDEKGIAHCGAGDNIKEASKPAILNVNDKNIAFLAYSNYTWAAPHIATEDTSGVNPLYIKQAEKDILDAKKKYDYVFVINHWGIEYTHFPPIECKTIAKRMIRAGADAIIGGHSHQVQPLITYKKRPIYFSLGNFLFPDFYMAPPRPIWYPSEKEKENNISLIYDYPYPLKHHAKRVWKEKARIGMIAQLYINKSKVKSHFRFSYLDENNRITLYKKEEELTKHLAIIGNYIKSPLYFTVQCLRHTYDFIKKFK